MGQRELRESVSIIGAVQSGRNITRRSDVYRLLIKVKYWD